uniref:Uncharacterized protein n=1 Tax=Knipowitschia caucasica TaxID=637954 RepID=A0AAV2K5D5_KNICA
MELTDSVAALRAQKQREERGLALMLTEEQSICCTGDQGPARRRTHWARICTLWIIDQFTQHQATLSPGLELLMEGDSSCSPAWCRLWVTDRGGLRLAFTC